MVKITSPYCSSINFHEMQYKASEWSSNPGGPRDTIISHSRRVPMGLRTRGLGYECHPVSAVDEDRQTGTKR